MKSALHLFRLLIALLLFAPGFFLSAQVRIWEEKITLPTYAPRPPDKNPMFYVPDAYQGAKRVLYPYPLMDNLSSEKTDQEHRALFLENEYIQLCVLPDLGGRLFYATDKTNNYEIFYRQHVIKPANIGMLGAWISGGIEWCVFHHHRASTYLPVDYRLVENEDGSKTIWFGEIEPRHRMKWSIGLTLHPGRSYIETDVRMYNRTEHTHSILYWANVATHVNEDYQVIFPPSVHQGTYHAKNSFIHWPISDEIYNGKDYTGQVDVSWWKNHPDPISIFAHNLQEDFMGGYDHSRDAGTVHVGNHHIVKGAKLWEWGPGDYGKMWDCEILTDEDGPYAELMVGGYSDNQPDYSWIKPGEVKSLKHYWYPVREIGGFKNAHLDAAINLEYDGDRLFYGVNTTKAYENAQIQLLEKGEVLYTEDISVNPAHPYRKEFRGDPVSGLSHLSVLLVDAEGREIISYKESEQAYDRELPEPVSPPLPPGEIVQIEELVLTGQRIMQFHNPGFDPRDYFQEAVQRDPLNARANLHLGNLAAKGGRFEDAADFYRKSIRRVTADYTRPRDCEALFRLGCVLKELNRDEAARDTLYRATWDQAYYAASHFELAGISIHEGNLEEALDHLDRSLSLNGVNPETHGLRSAILRRMGDPENADLSARRALEIDPLDHLASYELLLMNAYTPEEFLKLLNDNKENYLELASEYLRAGLHLEALGVLELAISSGNASLRSYPMIHYYCAYLNEILGEEEIAGHFYRSASAASTNYVFPFRFESLEILDAAISQNPSDARAWYYKGNILYDHQPERAMECWEKAVSLDPGLAIAYRNLGWGHFRYAGQIQDAIKLYEKAIEINPLEARYFYELDRLYERGNVSLKRRHVMLSSHHDVVQLRNDSYVREIEVLLLNGYYDQAIRHLEDHTFQRQEGVVNLHDLFVDAHLLKGRELMQNNQTKEALDHFLKADSYPGNHMIGRISNYRKEAQIFYYTGQAYQHMKQDKLAQQYFTRASETAVGSSEYLFYQALAYRALGEDKKAGESIDRLVKSGRDALKREEDTDFFAKFGEGRSADERRALAYYKIALGHKASGEHEKAREVFEQVIELKNSLIWANAYHD